MAKKTRTPRKKTAFVPRSVLSGLYVGAAVIPVCVASGLGCGGKTSGNSVATVAMSFADSGPDALTFTVACNCFDGSTTGVGVTAFDGSADVIATVAMIAFDGSTDGGSDGSVDDGAALDTGFFVADAGFGGG